MKPAQKPRPMEKHVQAAIVQFLKLRGALVVRTNSGAIKVDERFIRFNSAKGCSDLLVCYRGRWIALECKRDSQAVATADQLAFLVDVRLAGGVAAVVFDIRQVEDILNAIDNEEQE